MAGYVRRITAAVDAAIEAEVQRLVDEAVAPARREADEAHAQLVERTAERDAALAEVAKRDLQVGELTAEVARLRKRIEELEAGQPGPKPEPTPGLWYRRPEVKPSPRTLDVHSTPWFTGKSRTTQERAYLAPGGENGKHAAYGGYTRDLLTTFTAAEEIAALTRYGVQGVYVDLVAASTSHSHWPAVQALLDAAAGTGLHIMPMIDANGTGMTNATDAQVAAHLERFLSRPTARRLDDGRYVVGIFKAEGWPAARWVSIAAECAKLGRKIAYVGAFNDTGRVGDYPDLWAAGAWGYGADPAILDRLPSYVGQVSQRGQVPLVPWLCHNVRAAQGWYDESRGLGALRASWDQIVAVGDCIIQGVTASDIGEGSHMLPSALHGDALLAYSEWRSYEWRTGKRPEILAPAVFVSHRPQMLDAEVTSGQTRRMVPAGKPLGPGRPRQSPSLDEVELVTLLPQDRDDYEVELTIGDETKRFAVPSGEHAEYFTAKPGPVTVSVAGVTVTTPPILTRAVSDAPNWLTVWSGEPGKIFDPRPAP